jgi:hypothetical protein
MTPEPTPEQLAAELADHAPMSLVLRAATAFQLAALLQLALRHPKVDGTNRQTAETFVEGVRQFLRDCPHVSAVLARGDDPREDR